MSILDDAPAEVEASSGGFGRTLRSFVIWLFVLSIAVGAGFAGGYVLHYQELRDQERAAAEERAEMAAQLAAFERQILEAEKAQLEAVLSRANVVANLDEVLTRLPEALAEIEQFGRAMQDLDAAENALTDAGVSGESRAALGTTLGELRGRLTELDLKARARIAASAKNLEHAIATSEGAAPSGHAAGAVPDDPIAPADVIAAPAEPIPPSAEADPDPDEDAEAPDVPAPPDADPPPDVPASAPPVPPGP